MHYLQTENKYKLFNSLSAWSITCVKLGLLLARITTTKHLLSETPENIHNVNFEIFRRSILWKCYYVFSHILHDLWTTIRGISKKQLKRIRDKKTPFLFHWISFSFFITLFFFCHHCHFMFGFREYCDILETPGHLEPKRFGFKPALLLICKMTLSKLIL